MLHRITALFFVLLHLTNMHAIADDVARNKSHEYISSSWNNEDSSFVYLNSIYIPNSKHFWVIVGQSSLDSALTKRVVIWEVALNGDLIREIQVVDFTGINEPPSQALVIPVTGTVSGSAYFAVNEMEEGIGIFRLDINGDPKVERVISDPDHRLKITSFRRLNDNVIYASGSIGNHGAIVKLIDDKPLSIHKVTLGQVTIVNDIEISNNKLYICGNYGESSRFDIEKSKTFVNMYELEDLNNMKSIEFDGQYGNMSVNNTDIAVVYDSDPSIRQHFIVKVMDKNLKVTKDVSLFSEK